MIIKRNQLPKRTHAEAPAFSGVEEDTWTQEALEAGEVQERRNKDRRHDFRRVDDQQLISRAHEEANAIRERAHAEGFDEGLRQADHVIQELRHTLHQLVNLREEALQSIANEIAPLAIEVAQRIIKTEVSCDEALVMNLVRDTIQKAGRNNKSILIKVHPDEVRMVKHSLKTEPIPNLNAELVVMEEPSVEAGSCIIETNSGLIDASFSTQLGLLKRLFGLGGRD